MRSLAAVLDDHADLSPAVRDLIGVAWQQHPRREELQQMLDDGAWLLGSAQDDGRLELRIGFPKRIGHPDNPNAPVRLMVLPAAGKLPGGRG
jgi:hypothetical protein